MGPSVGPSHAGAALRGEGGVALRGEGVVALRGEGDVLSQEGLHRDVYVRGSGPQGAGTVAAVQAAAAVMAGMWVTLCEGICDFM